MKHLLPAFLILFSLTFTSQAQNEYQPGYIIKNDGQKISCLIYNEDWRSTPTSIAYKLNVNSQKLDGPIKDIKQFEIIGKIKFIRAYVDIDRSRDDLKRITWDRNPTFNTETIWLKTLIEGDPTLFYYRDGELERFFYQIDQGVVNQLVYKRYRTESGVIKTNNQFRQQLSNSISCVNRAKIETDKLSYSEKSLISYFEKINTCRNNEYVKNVRPKNKEWLKLHLTSGLNWAQVTQRNSSIDRSFDDKLSARVGLQCELVLPFNNDKWSIVIDPNFQYYKSEVVDRRSLIAINYKSLEVPIGVRYYIFLNDKSRVFINALFSADFAFKSNAGSLEISTHTLGRSNVHFGAGFSFGRLSAELRYSMRNDLTVDYLYLSSDYSRSSFVVGYRIF